MAIRTYSKDVWVWLRNFDLISLGRGRQTACGRSEQTGINSKNISTNLVKNIVEIMNFVFECVNVLYMSMTINY